MDEAVTAQQIFERLSPYDLNRVTFLMPDGLPVVAAYIDTDLRGGAVIILSDTDTPSDDWWDANIGKAANRS